MSSGAVNDLAHCFGYVRNFPDTLHRAQFSLLLVIVDDRKCLRFIDTQAVTYGFLVVVGPVAQPASACIASTIDMRGGIKDVVYLPAGQAGPPPDQPLQQRIDVHSQQQGQIQRTAHAAQQLIERFGLRKTAGKSIQNEAVTRVGTQDPFLYDTQYDVVANQMAGVHGQFRLASQRGSGNHRLAKNVTRSYLRDVVTLGEEPRLGTLARPGRTQQYDSHLANSPGMLLIFLYSC